ncbi:hypothetical protein AAW00_01450 [Aurantiacibacter luteus]|uniref:Uncharacterized protein n=1 Tax=Aurantiacibacter luteus TaxID=1581420 RepID=A0A0G9MWW4_9SPHN|nr:hypothetical protein AAW00_01450 [Aurantiacibacter luteus]
MKREATRRRKPPDETPADGPGCPFPAGGLRPQRPAGREDRARRRGTGDRGRSRTCRDRAAGPLRPARRMLQPAGRIGLPRRIARSG